jgi:hypothetical protein
VALSLSKIFLTISGLRVSGIIAAAFGVLTVCHFYNYYYSKCCS